MRKYIALSTIFVLGFFSSCDKTLEELNVNPNDPLDAAGEQLLLGTQIANISINVSHLQRISGMWSGQYEGTTLLYQSLHQYNMSSEEANDTWSTIYQGVVKQSRILQEKLPGSTPKEALQRAIAKIMEAYAVGTAAEIFGDVPYREASNPDIANPVFDPQAQVFSDLQTLLTNAINELATVTTAQTLKGDMFYNQGSSGATVTAKWVEAAHTLKARYFMDVKDYSSAYAEALLGISTFNNTMMFRPPTVSADVVQNGNANLLWTFVRERSGYMRSTSTFMAGMLGTTASTTRRNAKTNEDARSKYLAFSGTGNPSTGVAARTTPMKLVSFEENTLILAEAGARTVSAATGLGHLNTLRAYLQAGNSFTKVSAADVLLYSPYVLSDFDPAGIENFDGSLTQDRALLREIIEERYVSGVGTFMPFNDARRLRKSDTDVDVNFPLNFGTTYPERMVSSQREFNANSSAPPTIPGVFEVTPVNK
ncbi:MAG: SusD/RagB family nutrient-binding outer membrane lipoprotein [Cyclobacteriaceae bacterium]